MCKLFKDNRENILTLIYDLKEFSAEELNDRITNDGLIGDALNINEFLLNLCNLGLLKNNRYSYKLIPEEDQVGNQLFLCEVG